MRKYILLLLRIITCKKFKNNSYCPEVFLHLFKNLIIYYLNGTST